MEKKRVPVDDSGQYDAACRVMDDTSPMLRKVMEWQLHHIIQYNSWGKKEKNDMTVDTILFSAVQYFLAISLYSPLLNVLPDNKELKISAGK